MSLFDDWNNADDVIDLQKFLAAQQTAKPKGKKKTSGRGGTLTSLISEGGATGGALGGGALGTMVLPGVGTAIGAGIGGLVGGIGGRLAENKVRDDRGPLDDGSLNEALFEGALSAVGGAGVKNVAKAGKVATGALKGKAGKASLEEAVSGAPLKASVQGRMQDMGNKLLTAEYGTIGKNVARSTDASKTIGQLADAGIVGPKNVERMAGAITGSDGSVNKVVAQAVGGAHPVNTSSIMSVLDDNIKNLGLVDSDAKEVTQIVAAKLKSLGDNADPTKTLQVMRDLSARIADYKGKGGNYKMSDPRRMEKARTLQAVHDSLEQSLNQGAGANNNLPGLLTPQFRDELVNLMPDNPKWAQYVDGKVMGAKSVDELRSSTAPFVKGSQIIDEADLNSMTFGGRGGNVMNTISQGGLTGLGLVAADMARKPLARVAGGALRSASSNVTPSLTAPTAKGIVGRMGAFNAGEAVMTPQPTQAMGLEDAVSGQPQMEDFSVQPETQQSPYPKENLMYDIQRDPKNAQKYLEYYQMMEEMFGATEGKDLSAQARTSMATSANALDTLGLLEQRFGEAGGGQGKIGGFFGNQMARAGQNEKVGLYNDNANSTVTQLAKALAGGGQVSDADAAALTSALPQITDSPEKARAKFEDLRRRLAAARQNSLVYNTASNGSLEDSVTQGAY